MKGKQAMKAPNNQQPPPPQTPNTATKNVATESEHPPLSPGIVVEPSADMAQQCLAPQTNFPALINIPPPEPTVDQDLQSAEEAFFDIIDQVFSNTLNKPLAVSSL